jgi:hypothetical protein
MLNMLRKEPFGLSVLWPKDYIIEPNQCIKLILECRTKIKDEKENSLFDQKANRLKDSACAELQSNEHTVCFDPHVECGRVTVRTRIINNMFIVYGISNRCIKNNPQKGCGALLPMTTIR